MKKLLLGFGSTFLLAFVSMAQITVTQSNMPTIGNVAIEREDTVFSGTTIGNAGANQTWNFANWVNQKQNLSGFVSPGTLAGASNFPTATIGINDGSGNSQFAFSNSSSFDILGMYGDFLQTGTAVALKFNPGLKIISVPSTYNTSYSGIYTYNMQLAYPYPPYADSVRIESSTSYTSLMDGWGTLTTPSQTNIAALRQNYRDITTRTTYVHMLLPTPSWTVNGAPTVDTTYSYRWWSNSISFPLSEISLKKSVIGHTDSVTSVKWLHSYQPGTVEIAENSTVKKEVSVFPNPATDVINISGISETSAIVISDITGKVVNGTILDKTNNTLNISKFDNGLYLYQIHDTKGNITSNGRFVIVK